MGKGKTAAQCCHACLGAYKRALVMRPAHVRAWNHGQAKVVLRCETAQELFVFHHYHHIILLLFMYLFMYLFVLFVWEQRSIGRESRKFGYS